ncbi:MAG: hypothetical protein ACFFED_01815 [Candidatus Thorarchaeota archaeon]
MNGDTLEEIDIFSIHPDLVNRIGPNPSDFQSNCLPVCYGCVSVGTDGKVLCASQKKQIIIRNRELSLKDLEDALDNFPRDMFTSEQDICNECLYKVLVSLILTS